MVVVGGGLVVVVVVVLVVVGAAGVVVDDPATVVVPGVSTSETGAGGVVLTERWEAHVVGVTAPPGRAEVVVDGVIGTGGVVVAAVLGPTVRTGPTSCTVCAGSRGLEPPGEKATSTASSTPTTASPASIPRRWDSGRCSDAASANSS